MSAATSALAVAMYTQATTAATAAPIIIVQLLTAPAIAMYASTVTIVQLLQLQLQPWLWLWLWMQAVTAGLSVLPFVKVCQVAVTLA